MKNKMYGVKEQILLWICCLSFIYASAQPQSLSENATISIITCGTGEELYTLFGHTALRVKDADQNLDVVYNWGMFDFRTPGFYTKFVKGNLLYYLDVDRFDDFLYNYEMTKREVVEQELNLDYSQKNEIWNEINRQLKSDDRYYTYGFIRNNCTTKVVDVLNKVLKNPLKTDFPSNKHSYRHILNEGLQEHYFEKLGINLLFGYTTNKQSDLIFLPVKFKDAIVYNKPILKSQNVLYSPPDVQHSTGFNSVVTLWVIVFVLSFGSFKTRIRFGYFLVTAIFGLFLLAVSVFTHHYELHFNAWILFFNPFLVVGKWRENRKLIVFGAAAAACGLLFMGTELVLIAMPLIVLHFIYMMTELFRKEKE